MHRCQTRATTNAPRSLDVSSPSALRNTDEQQAAFVDEGLDVALRRGLADDRVDRTLEQERAELV